MLNERDIRTEISDINFRLQYKGERHDDVAYRLERLHRALANIEREKTLPPASPPQESAGERSGE